MELRIHGYELTSRRHDARLIEIEEISEKENSQEDPALSEKEEKKKKERRIIIDHPGLGEGGK